MLTAAAVFARLLLVSRDPRVTWARKATWDPSDQKAVLSYRTGPKHTLFSSVIDKGGLGVIGVQGQKGDTVRNFDDRWHSHRMPSLFSRGRAR